MDERTGLFRQRSPISLKLAPDLCVIVKFNIRKKARNGHKFGRLCNTEIVVMSIKFSILYFLFTFWKKECNKSFKIRKYENGKQCSMTCSVWAKEVYVLANSEKTTKLMWAKLLRMMVGQHCKLNLEAEWSSSKYTVRWLFNFSDFNHKKITNEIIDILFWANCIC